MSVSTPEKAQEVRDLRSQMAELQADPEIIFRESSPRKRMATIYSMIDGEPLSVNMNQVERMLEKRLGAGYMFTARQEEAPEYKLGEVKCFLHAESPEQEILAYIGLSGARCNAAQLANSHSKRIHAQHRHSQEWAAYQEYVKDEKERAQIERENKQLEATLAIAGRASEAPAAPEVVKCAECDYEGTKQQVAGHRSAKHRAEVTNA